MKPNDAIHMQSLGGGQQGNVPSTPGAGAYSVHISANRGHRDNDDITPSAQNASALARSSHATAPYGGDANANDMRKRYHDINRAAWQYTKCAILFFTAMLITWIPSSANRVFSLTHNKTSSTALEFMSALVLPLQGFWNAIIYMVTTWSATKNLVNDLKMGRRPDVKDFVGGMAPSMPHHVHHSHHRHSQAPYRTGNRSMKAYETESMTELAESRPEH
jgi:hypothetical protein